MVKYAQWDERRRSPASPSRPHEPSLELSRRRPRLDPAQAAAQHVPVEDSALDVAIRAADPHDEILIGAVFTGLPAAIAALGRVPGVQFLAAVFGTGVLDVVDGVTFHPYRAEAPESVAAEVAAIRTLMAGAGRTLPLWSGEWGYSTYDPTVPSTGLNYLPAVSEARQASWIARMLLTDHHLGLAGSVIFKDRDAMAPDPGDIEDSPANISPCGGTSSKRGDSAESQIRALPLAAHSHRTGINRSPSPPTHRSVSIQSPCPCLPVPADG